jgi:hypothetical protein
MLHEARDEFRKEGLGDDEVIADGLLAKVLLSQGKVAEAQKEIAASHDLLAKSQDFSVRLRAPVAEAQVLAAGGKRDDAIRVLDETIGTAKKSGYLGYQLEAQLALGELQGEMPGTRAQALRLLADVGKQAQVKGFRLIANKAARAAAKSVAAKPVAAK